MAGIERITIIHDRVEARGGATGLARLCALEYRKLGLPVTFLTGEDGDAELEAAGVEIIGLGQQGLRTAGTLTALRKGLHNSEAAYLVASWIEANDTPGTVYHLHNWAQILSPAVFGALRAVEARTVVSCHDFFNICPNGGLLNFPKGTVCHLKAMSSACWMSQCDRQSPVHKYWRMIRQLHLRNRAGFPESAMTFVCLNKGMEDVMREAGFDAPNLTHIPNPAQAYTPERIPAEENDAFLFVGRLNREKGADLAAEAAHRAGVQLIMVGEGELAAPLSQRYPEIDFPGFCSRAQIAEFASKARALIVPGRWREPYGLVIADAALSGLPVILSAPSTLSGDIARRDMGTVFDPAEAGALEATLRALSEDDTAIARFSHNAHSRAGEICNTPESWAASFIELFETKLGLAR
ncbi:glycosyltransferase [Henriciella aquimarina]|uniref:glycosyltransferase n=1 Tax=Henriciella aquimarina TaxID=545261 RepID=UPI001301EDD1|nr:glycosyltransferase [Henriciella aquimarina]